MQLDTATAVPPVNGFAHVTGRMEEMWGSAEKVNLSASCPLVARAVEDVSEAQLGVLL